MHPDDFAGEAAADEDKNRIPERGRSFGSIDMSDVNNELGAKREPQTRQKGDTCDEENQTPPSEE